MIRWTCAQSSRGWHTTPRWTSPDRALAVAALLSEAMRPLGVSPVLVGGSAVLFWTRAPEFTTVDIDLVVDEPKRGGRVDVGTRVCFGCGPAPLVDPKLGRARGDAGPSARTVRAQLWQSRCRMADGRRAVACRPGDRPAQELLLAPLELPLRQVLALIPVIPDPVELLARAREVDRAEGVAFMRRNRCSGA